MTRSVRWSLGCATHVGRLGLPGSDLLGVRRRTFGVTCPPSGRVSREGITWPRSASSQLPNTGASFSRI
jgi:hypothetical protein